MALAQRIALAALAIFLLLNAVTPFITPDPPWLANLPLVVAIMAFLLAFGLSHMRAERAHKAKATVSPALVASSAQQEIQNLVPPIGGKTEVAHSVAARLVEQLANVISDSGRSSCNKPVVFGMVGISSADCIPTQIVPIFWNCLEEARFVNHIGADHGERRHR